MSQPETIPAGKAETALSIPLAEAGQRLSKRIEKGHSILPRRCETPFEKHRFETEYQIWLRATQDLLQDIFTTDAVVKAAFYVRWVSGPIPPPEPDDLSAELKRLASIRKRVELRRFPVVVEASGPVKSLGRIARRICMAARYQLYRAMRLLEGYVQVTHSR